MSTDNTPAPELLKAFVIAGHFDLEMVKTMLTENPALLNAEHQWKENDYESALGGAAHVGNRAIAEYLLEQGARLTIFAAAMLGRADEVQAFLESDASLANGRGAHGIPVMAHAAHSGLIDVAQMLKAYGCTEGYDAALLVAVMDGHTRLVKWLLENGVENVDVTDMKGRTPLQLAREFGHDEIVALLQERGATDS
ncbi:MAG: ankyrin repeat domain-containing protein [Chloroflexi bacterium]|nr:MAG: ankyrin repeat domain-containing protein [Chloroflexota bacterium]